MSPRQESQRVQADRPFKDAFDDEALSRDVSPLAYRRSPSQERRLLERWYELAAIASPGCQLAKEGDRSLAKQFQNTLNALGIESAVMVQDERNRLILCNRACEELFYPSKFERGCVLPESMPSLVRQQLLAGGVLMDVGAHELKYQFDALDSLSKQCQWIAYHRRYVASDPLAEVRITMIRPVAVFQPPPTDRGNVLSKSYSIYKQFDETDRQICEGIAAGDSTGEIAELVGLTRRSVEVRRNKILDRLKFKRPVEIVRLLVRFEENGLLTLR